LWIPVAVDCVIHFPGNLWRIMRTFATGTSGQRPIGLRTAADTLAREFRWLPPWLGGHEAKSLLGLALPTPAWWLALAVALLAAAALAARRRDHREDLRLVGLLGVSLAVGFLALSRVVGEPYPYLFYWRSVLGSSLVIFSLLIIMRSLAGRAEKFASGALAVLLVVATGWSSIVLAGSVVRAPQALDGNETVVAALVRQLNELGQPRQPVLIRPAGGFGGLGDGILDELDREGKAVKVDASTLNAYGYHRVAKPAEVSALWYVVEDSTQFSLLSAQPGATVVVRTAPLSPANDAELSRLQRTLAAQLDESGHSDLMSALNTSLVTVILRGIAGVDQAAVARVAQLDRLVASSGTCRCAILSFPPDEPPS
jgi:hypothetical protein